jgi:hypothetical protein
MGPSHEPTLIALRAHTFCVTSSGRRNSLGCCRMDSRKGASKNQKSGRRFAHEQIPELGRVYDCVLRNAAFPANIALIAMADDGS